MSKKVGYVLQADEDQQTGALKEMGLGLDFDTIVANTLPELFFILNDRDSRIELVIFHLPTLFTDTQCDAYGIISTISTLVACNHDAGYALPAVAVLIDGSSSSAQLQQLLGTEIKGVVPNPQWLGAAETTKALKELLSGRTYLPKYLLDKTAQSKVSINSDIKLTPRQTQILRLICNRGAPNKTIARMMDISESTVKLHITAILKKFGVRNRTQLALFAGATIKDSKV